MLHLKYELVNMLDNECEDCTICEYIEADLNDAMERLDDHLQSMGLAVTFEKPVARLDNFSDTR